MIETYDFKTIKSGKEIEVYNYKDKEILKKVKFVVQAKINFEKDNQKDRRIILNEIGSNREIKDKKLTIMPYKWLIPVQKDIKGLKVKFYRFELDKTPLNTTRKEAYTSLCRNLLGEWDVVGTFLSK